jgi:alpha-L-fucosidase
MKITRRDALKIAGAMAALSAKAAVPSGLKIAKGKYDGSRESLKAWQAPEWFRDAKLGFWAHWGPQSAPEQGDWYARNMYIQDSAQYKYHVATYGHPSKFGFKDVIPTWKGDRFDPDHLISLYKKAGAKYFVSMGVHHDNFDLWNSKHTRWNSVNMGPKKDIVGMWAKAARNAGLKFGVSEHLWISYKWFAVSHLSDKTGPLAGVSYDGVDPANADLYHEAAVKAIGEKFTWDDQLIPEAWKRHWFARIQDLVDQYHPDLLYTDGAMPFEDFGSSMVSHLYNSVPGSVYNSKRQEDCAGGSCILDVERGVVDKVWPDPWQTDTCVGQWHYKRDVKYKSPKTVIDMLCDIVSRNGNLLLNFPLPNSGEPDAQELKIVDEITKWMAVNSEGIYATRPWKTYGEGAATVASGADSKFNESKRKDMTASDIRFTTKGPTIYAFVMGWPEGEAVVRGLGLKSEYQPGKVTNVELLGHGKVAFRQEDGALRVTMPQQKPSEYAVALKVYRS